MTGAKDKVVALSAREKEILKLSADGLIDKQIAEHLGVSVATVRTYWLRLRRKLGAVNKSHAIKLGMPDNELDRLDDEIANFILRSIEEQAIFVCDHSGKLLTWNKGVERVFGYREDEWIGQHASIFFKPEEKSDAARELGDAEVAGASVNYRWHVRKDGTRFWGANTVLHIEPARERAAYAKIVRPELNAMPEG
jgi:PAS domain S-box-containing protein